MATTATTTGRSAPAADDAFALLRRLVPMLLSSSYERTPAFSRAPTVPPLGQVTGEVAGTFLGALVRARA